MERFNSSYDFWMILQKECEKVEFTDDHFENAKAISRIKHIFTIMSKLWLNKYTNLNEIADIYCDFNKGDFTDYEKAFKEFSGYVWYSSDRMNINRWLYCRMIINYAFELVYSKIDAKRWYSECSHWVENTYISYDEMQVQKWFDENFEKLYNAQLTENKKEGEE